MTSRHRCGVLVVDDDPVIRDLLRVWLTGDGYEVATVNNGAAALYHLRSHTDTCVILLDLMLPGMDGAQFRMAQLRDRSLAWVPIVVMSGGVEAAQAARAFGARGFVGKPLNLDRLRQTLLEVGCCRTRSDGSRGISHGQPR